MFIRAATVCGTDQALAERLNVSVEELAGWIAGKGMAPRDVYNRVAELVRQAGLDALKF